jgi:predicted enzyme related to lactoylglutathione lyase
VLTDPFGHRWMVAGPVAVTPGPVFRHGDVGYVSLWVRDVTRAARFFAAVLGWRYGPASGPEGRRVEGQTLHHGLWTDDGPPSLFCCYAVADLAAARAAVVAAGGTAGEAHPEPYGLIADCVDPAGTRFALFEPPEGTAPPGTAAGPGMVNGSRPGDVAYLTMEVVDAAAARAFYGAVLGWTFDAGRVDDGWQVRDAAPMVGLSGGHPVATTVPLYRVEDVEGTVAAVRAAGGTATDPEPQPYGLTAACTDDQGTRFVVGRLS